MSHLIVLDNEAVLVLNNPAHRKHRRVVSHIQVVASRKRRGVPLSAVVPTAVRAEAGWDRTARSWAFPNSLRIADAPLDSADANVAAAIRRRAGVSVRDAHVGALVRAASADQAKVVTSDPADMRAVAGDREIVVVAL